MTGFWSKTRTVTSIETLLSGMPPDDPARRRALQRARAFAQDCGCSAGAAGMTLAAAAVVVRWVTSPGPDLLGVISAVGFVLAATMAGKAAGLAAARVRLSLLRRSLARAWQR